MNAYFIVHPQCVCSHEKLLQALVLGKESGWLLLYCYETNCLANRVWDHIFHSINIMMLYVLWCLES